MQYASKELMNIAKKHGMLTPVFFNYGDRVVSCLLINTNTHLVVAKGVAICDVSQDKFSFNEGCIISYKRACRAWDNNSYEAASEAPLNLEGSLFTFTEDCDFTKNENRRDIFSEITAAGYEEIVRDPNGSGLKTIVKARGEGCLLGRLTRREENCLKIMRGDIS